MEIIKPASPILQRYVDFFYFSPASKGAVSYVAFPHTNICLSFFYKSDVHLNDEEFTIIPAKTDTDVSAFVTGIYSSPVYVNYQSEIKEIAIIFKPLGMHHFVDRANRYIHSSPGKSFNESLWLQFVATIINCDDQDLLIHKLEQFMLSQLRSSELLMLYKSIDLLNDFENYYSIDEMARLLHVHRRTLERHFTLQVGCTPSTYRRIARFRKSVDLLLLAEHIRHLTRVAHSSNYYDQSYFVREFRKLTNSSPKQFFQKITSYEKNKIVWVVK